jgi:carbon storage regulator CsrA
VLIGPSIKLEFVGLDAKHRARLIFTATRHLKLASADIALKRDIPAEGPENPARYEAVLAVDQKIKLNDIIEVTIVAVKGEQVRLGLEAPNEVHIFREEVHAEILQEGFKTSRKEGEAAPEKPPRPPRELEDEPPPD